jgi:uncharacterized membrane protein YqiK
MVFVFSISIFFCFVLFCFVLFCFVFFFFNVMVCTRSSASGLLVCSDSVTGGMFDTFDVASQDETGGKRLFVFAKANGGDT